MKNAAATNGTVITSAVDKRLKEEAPDLHGVDSLIRCIAFTRPDSARSPW